jgi:hypothetical protein
MATVKPDVELLRRGIHFYLVKKNRRFNQFNRKLGGD